MEKLNYELVGKKATIEGLMSGEISISELSKFYMVDIEDQEIRALIEDATLDEVISAISNPNILFIQKSDYNKYKEDFNDDDSWDDEEVVLPIKKKRSR